LIEREILPPLIADCRAAGRPLRLWSAGCCTGEEAYSLAMVVDRLWPQREPGQASLLATDLNPRFLRIAARGEFGAWSFRDAPEGLRERGFTPLPDGRFALRPRIRAMVRFAQLNLAEPGWPAWGSGTVAMDLILCRNVLMYFALPRVQQVLGRLCAALADGGWLSLGAAESPAQPVPGLQAVPFDGATFHRKPGNRSIAATASTAAIAPAAPPAATPAVQPAPQAAPAAAAPAPALLPPARALADAGRLQQALAGVEQALAADKLDAEAHYLHAAILQELARDGDAEQALRRAVYLEPGFALAHHALGRLALRQQRRADALRHFRQTLAELARWPDDSVLPHSDGLAAGHLRAMVEGVLAAWESR
jgi:chemotaxis protein methyltransferase CheR